MLLWISARALDCAPICATTTAALFAEIPQPASPFEEQAAHEECHVGFRLLHRRPQQLAIACLLLKAVGWGTLKRAGVLVIRPGGIKVLLRLSVPSRSCAWEETCAEAPGRELTALGIPWDLCGVLAQSA